VNPTYEHGLIWGTALTQLIGWGTLFLPFSIVLEPMEAELGWSRGEINGALTAGLLISGILGIPVGRWVDRHGGRLPLVLGALLGAAVLVGWAMVDRLWVFYLLWIAMGCAHATALWGPAMAVVVALARQPARAIAGITFVTGFSATIFVPLLRELGLPESSVLLLVALHGPTQVAARAVLYFAGKRASMRVVGLFAVPLIVLAQLWLTTAPPLFVWLLPFVLCWAVADGLMTIVRAAGTAEILGREGYGAITGAVTLIGVLPRTAAPFVIALVWQASGGYGAVPWLLASIAALGAGAFLLAVRDRG
jgi:sugar phosphate permease